MRYALMTEPQQGLTYDELLALARTAEESGIEAFFRSDHYTSFPGAAGLPTTDAWSTLAGLARETSRIHLGTLVSPVTFRIPGSFAKVVATVDQMSGGRIEVGMGAGWNQREHAELGIPYPPELRERYDRLEEALAVVTGLWCEPDGWTFEGRHWQVRGSRFAPRPSGDGRCGPHLILGGDGGPRLARLVARYADEFNRQSATPDRVREAYGRVRAACESIGRDPATVVLSAMVGVLIGESPGDVEDRARDVLAAGGEADAKAWLDERRERWIMGTPDQALARVAELEAAGVQRLMLQDFLPRDLDHVRLMGRVFNPGWA